LHVCSYINGKRYSTPVGVVQISPRIFYKHLMPPASRGIHYMPNSIKQICQLPGGIDNEQIDLAV
jgi:hypothetical protein